MAPGDYRSVQHPPGDHVPLRDYIESKFKCLDELNEARSEALKIAAEAGEYRMNRAENDIKEMRSFQSRLVGAVIVAAGVAGLVGFLLARIFGGQVP